MAHTVGDVVEGARRILQEVGAEGIRWTNTELLEWLNLAYATILAFRPDAFSHQASVSLAEGVEQTLPADGVRLLDVLATAGGHPVRWMDSLALARIRPGWRLDPKTERLEGYLYNPEAPRHFQVYPPAKAGTELTLVYAREPEPHATDNMGDVHDQPLRVEVGYTPILVDLVLYRAFSKDAEHQANMARATHHMQAAYQGLGVKAQGDAAAMPAAPPGGEA